MPNYTRARWAVSLIFAINGFLYANWVSRIPRLQELYSIDHFQLGLVLLAGSIGAWIAMPITGRIIVKYGSRRITTVMILAFVALTPFIALTPHFTTLALSLLLIGAVSGSLDVAMNAQAVLVEQGMGKPIMTSFHAIFSAGMMLGSAFGGLANKWLLPLHHHLLLVAGLSILGAAWAVRRLLADEEQAVAAQAEKSTTLSELFRRPSLFILGLVAFCCMLGEGAMADWTTNYLEKISMAAVDIAPLGLFAFSGAMTLGRFLGDGFRARWGDEVLLLGGSIIAIAGMLLALGWTQPEAGIAGFFLVGLGLATIVPIAYSTAGSLPGLAPGVGISMVTTIGYAGFLVGPPVIGFISDAWGLHIGMGFILLLFIIMLALTLVAQRRRKRLEVGSRG